MVVRHRKDLCRPYRVGVLPRFVLPVLAMAGAFAAALWIVLALLGLLDVLLGSTEWAPLVAVLLLGAAVFSLWTAVAWKVSRVGVWVGTEGVLLHGPGGSTGVHPWEAFRGSHIADGALVIEFDEAVVVARGLSSASPLTWAGSSPSEICDAVDGARPGHQPS